MKTIIINTIVVLVLCAGFCFAEGVFEDYDYDDDYYEPVNYDRVINRENYDESFLQYRDAIINTRDMTFDQHAQTLVMNKGLNLLNITWEDTGRYLDSCVGPNISDMTIQVGLEDPVDGFFELFLMPIIRYPNYTDLTTDLDPQDFTLLVGNEKGESLKRISLYQFLEDPCSYLTDPGSWPGDGHKSLLAERDVKVLVSAQACFLPVPKQGKAVFNPVLFNYQSYAGDPAVLTILATREGTSVTIIDNVRDAFSSGALWGQRLFFNRAGERASLTGERMSDFLADPENSQKTGEDKGPSVSPQDQENNLNMVLLIQVPLKQKYSMRAAVAEESMDDFPSAAGGAECKSRDIEKAVIGSGKAEGPFTEIDHIAIERDPNFPVRVTVQFYLATATGQITEDDMDSIFTQIDKVYKQGDYISSLVTGGGKTGRITEYAGTKVQPPDWWDRFWDRYEKNTGIKREEARKQLIRLLGTGYREQEVSDLYLRDVLKSGSESS